MAAWAALPVVAAVVQKAGEEEPVAMLAYPAMAVLPARSVSQPRAFSPRVGMLSLPSLHLVEMAEQRWVQVEMEVKDRTPMICFQSLVAARAALAALAVLEVPEASSH